MLLLGKYWWFDGHCKKAKRLSSHSKPKPYFEGTSLKVNSFFFPIKYINMDYINNLLFIKIILVWRFFKACRFLCANRRKIEHNKRPKSFSRALLICWTTKWSGFRKYRATGSARKTAIIAKLVKQHRLRILLEGKPET